MRGASPPLFFCPALLGAAPSHLSGHHAVRAIAGVGIRDALQAVGGMPRMLPLARGALAAELGQAARQVFQYPDVLYPVAVEKPPKLALVDSALSQSAEPPAPTAARMPPPPESQQRSMVSQILETCAALLRDHVPNCQQALHNGFFTALRYEIAPHLRPPLPDDPPHFGSGASALRAACDDEGVISAALAIASAAATLPELKIDAWRTLICWAPLYAHASASVQQQLFHQLRRIARAQPTLFRSEVGVGFLVDALKLWYTAVSSPTASPTLGDAATSGELGGSGDAPALPYVVRHELLREFLRFLGCAILAAPAVLHPSEIQVRCRQRYLEFSRHSPGIHPMTLCPL